MSEAGQNRPAPGPLAFDGNYLQEELGEREVALRNLLAEKRAECLRIEGQILEASYWRSLIRAAQPAAAGGGAQGAAPSGDEVEPTKGA